MKKIEVFLKETLQDNTIIINNSVEPQIMYQYAYLLKDFALLDKRKIENTSKLIDSYRVDNGWKLPINVSPSLEATYYALDTKNMLQQNVLNKEDKTKIMNFLRENSNKTSTLREYYYYRKIVEMLDIEDSVPREYSEQQLFEEAYWYIKLSEISKVPKIPVLDGELKKIYNYNNFEKDSSKKNIVELYRESEVYSYLYKNWYEEQKSAYTHLISDFKKQDNGYGMEKSQKSSDILGCFTLNEFSKKLIVIYTKTLIARP